MRCNVAKRKEKTRHEKTCEHERSQKAWGKWEITNLGESADQQETKRHPVKARVQEKLCQQASTKQNGGASCKGCLFTMGHINVI